MRAVLTSYRRPDGKRRRPRQTLGREWVTLEILTARGIMCMAAKRWSGWVLWSWASKHGPVSVWPDDWSYSETRLMKRKNKPSEGSTVTAQASLRSTILAQCPHVVEHLAVRQYEDGGARQTGRLMVDVVGSMWRCLAKDADSGMQLVVYMPSLDDALLSLELLLGADEAPWEPDPYARQPGPKKGKK